MDSAKPRSASMPRSAAGSIAGGVAPSGGRTSDSSASVARILAAAGTSPDQQVATLRKKVKDLEAECRSNGESTQWTVHQNKETLAAMKAENKTLRQDLSTRGRGSGSKTSVSKATEKLEREVHDLRRQYDKLMQEKKTALSKLQNLQDSVNEMSKAAGGGFASAVVSPNSLNSSIASNASASGGASSRQARQLENRLEKAMMKSNEAQSIRHMYEEIIEKMKRERDTFDGQVKALEEAQKAAAVDHDKLVISGREMHHAKEQAKQELAAFEEEISRARAQREARSLEMRSNSQLVQSTNESLLQRQYPSAISTLKSPAAALGAGSSGQDVPPESPPPPEIASRRDAVRRLCSAVGAPSIEDLLDRLLPQQETGNNLKGMRSLADRQLKELESDVYMAKQHLEDMKGGSSLSTQAQLDAAEGDLQESTGRSESARIAHDVTMTAYINARSGLDHLASMVGGLPAPAGAVPLMPATSVAGGINAAGTLTLGHGSFGSGDEDISISEALSQVEQRLAAANKFIASLPKAAQLLEDMLGNPDFAFSTTAPPS